VLTNVWYRTPYPGEKKGEGPWVKATTPYERRMCKLMLDGKWKPALPVIEQEEKPNETANA